MYVRTASNMKIYDISVELNENTPVYEGDPKFRREVIKHVDQDGYTLSKFEVGSHTGTHVDAPCHFIANGKTLAQIELERFIGKCYVTKEPLEFPEGTERLLIKGKKGKVEYETARCIADRGVKLVGTEMLSVGGDATHQILLGSDIVILETLNLAEVPEGEYTLYAPPLKTDADGCPVRACLLGEDA